MGFNLRSPPCSCAYGQKDGNMCEDLSYPAMMCSKPSTLVSVLHSNCLSGLPKRDCLHSSLLLVDFA